MRKQRSDTVATLDTQVVINNKKESIFRHVENGTLRLLTVLHYNTTRVTAYVADIVESPGMHWRINREAYETYIARCNAQRVNVEYDTWV